MALQDALLGEKYKADEMLVIREQSRLYHMLTNFGIYYKSNEKFGDFVFWKKG